MKEKIATSIKKLLAISAAFTLCWLLIRLYSALAISGRVGEVEGLFGIHLRGAIEDLGVSVCISFGIILLCSIFGLLAAKISQIASLVFFSLILLIGFAINQYFVVTLIPLSADLFGYSFSDIKTTVGASGSTLNISLFVCLSIVVAFIFLARKLLKWDLTHQLSLRSTLIAIVGMLAIALLPWRVQPDDYENDFSYFIAVNKPGYLVDRTIEFINEQSDKRVFAKDVYPLLHAVNYTDSLGRYFNSFRNYPNIVFVIVEGLGRDFCGANAPYGGFTPFIDSLSTKSLYWENALSNAGRTFGAPPSILGSLPYSKLGMMGYGNEMPDHQTLISLLKPYGYRSNFFYGGNPNFDNLDIFLERQGVDFFMNESNFPKQASPKAFWGFSDQDLFSTALRKIESETSQRLDIFLTLSTHEPFVCPDSAVALKVDERISKMQTSKKKDIMLSQKNIFECLAYTDNAIKELMLDYSRRPDFSNTIFIITGDHRLIPVPQDNKIKRFHVPILVYSPMLKQPVKFSALTTHSAILPGILNFLHSHHGMTFPSELPLISPSLPTKREFSSDLDITLIRNKNEVRDYVSGTFFLSENRLYKILPGLQLEVVSRDSEKEKLKNKLKDFQSASTYAFENNKLDKVQTKRTTLFAFNAKEKKYLSDSGITKLNPDDQFVKARARAFAKDYFKSRAISKNILNKSPNYHDARILLARTFAWDGKYDSAKLFLEQTIQRAPTYADAYAALSDVYFWKDQLALSLTTVDNGLKFNSADAELLSRKARALTTLGQNREARKIIEDLSKRPFENEITSQLKRKFK
ncbi:hypothetical protein WSM22_32400 [Cytophagales bacterium WSM2-2]|nr:hypothetical protein WSM22_32400 [Cytophagales bacterium WSM2-2]